MFCSKVRFLRILFEADSGGKKPPEAAGKGGGAVFLGACLQVWRSRLTEESTRAPHKRAQDTRATHRTYDPIEGGGHSPPPSIGS